MISSLKTWLLIAILAVIVVGLIGLIAVWANIPLLFASLGPSVAIQVSTPQRRIARPWNVAVGHLIALGIGIAAVYATGAINSPPFLDSHPLSFERVAAAAFAIGVGLFVEFLLRASHPPAASTSLLVTLGVVEINWRGIGAVLAGIALVTALGEAARWARMRQR